MKWCFSETDHDQNRIVGWHRRNAQFDVFGFLIRGSLARWQRATRALFNHSPEVIAIFCHQMLFPLFWMPFENVEESGIFSIAGGYYKFVVFHNEVVF